AFAEQHQVAAEALRRASEAAEEPGLKRYLSLRADALLTDEYQASDMAWLDMKDNAVDVVIGPIETYEDLLFGYKAAHEAYILIKDQAWSERLSRFASLLPELQRGLPVPEAYKREMAGSDSDLNAYDVVYYAGQANAGSKTIAINLPNDEEVQLAKGTRRLQLKNTMRAKFDRILVPIAGELIAEDQRSNVTFDAFFANTMFHEVAHGLGIKNTVDGSSTVRGALLETASAMEEGKADVLGLYMVTSLLESGEITEGTLEDYYVTFIASIFRSVRFGATSAHGRANMVRFNYFQERGAFSRDAATGTYRVDFDAMGAAINGLSELILTLQGDGDHHGAAALLAEKGVVVPALQADLDRLGSAGIPVDIIFEQGESVLFGG
ncbi:MAG: Zn-dependent hydrolase, partial [Longimicrobiales bacterium]